MNSASHPLFATVDGQLVVVPYGIFGGMYHVDSATADQIVARFRSWFFAAIIPGMFFPAITSGIGGAATGIVAVVIVVAGVASWAFMVKPLVAHLQPIPGRARWFQFLAAQARELPLRFVFLPALAGLACVGLTTADVLSWHVFSLMERIALLAFASYYVPYGLFVVAARFLHRRTDHGSVAR